MSFKRKDCFHVKGMSRYDYICDGLLLGCRGGGPPLPPAAQANSSTMLETLAALAA
jgi:hypothetical protein